eukprot:SAG11_NODE_8892_length_965_cov_1.250577_1_plen_220_part_01
MCTDKCGQRAASCANHKRADTTAVLGTEHEFMQLHSVVAAHAAQLKGALKILRAEERFANAEVTRVRAETAAAERRRTSSRGAGHSSSSHIFAPAGAVELVEVGTTIDERLVEAQRGIEALASLARAVAKRTRQQHEELASAREVRNSTCSALLQLLEGRGELTARVLGELSVLELLRARRACRWFRCSCDEARLALPSTRLRYGLCKAQAELRGGALVV